MRYCFIITPQGKQFSEGRQTSLAPADIPPPAAVEPVGKNILHKLQNFCEMAAETGRPKNFRRFKGNRMAVRSGAFGHQPGQLRSFFLVQHRLKCNEHQE
jgi:hypothetical protein